MASLREEISHKLPWIAEKAVSEAGRQWRKRAEEETTAVRVERDRRLKELQVLTKVESSWRNAQRCSGSLTQAWCQDL